MRKRLNLNLNEKTHLIEIKFKENDYPWYEADAWLIKDRKRIAHLFVRDNLIELLDRLTASAHNAINRETMRFFSDDIGLAWNNHLYHSTIHTCPSGNPCEKNELDSYPNPMWSTPDGISSWLYWSGTEIIFEVTEDYPWFFSDPKRNETYYSYEEFLKNYQPIFKEVISQQHAQEWFNKALSWYPDPRWLPRSHLKDKL